MNKTKWGDEMQDIKKLGDKTRDKKIGEARRKTKKNRDTRCEMKKKNRETRCKMIKNGKT